MKKEALILYKNNGCLRTVFKTSHGRIIYIELAAGNNKYIITECFYADRKGSNGFYAIPKKLHSLNFEQKELLKIVEKELDRKFYGVNISNEFQEKNKSEFIEYKLKSFNRKYNFLIMLGSGECINGIPSIMKTLFKNKIHRSIYIGMIYFKDETGVINECYFCDRKYKVRKKVTPDSLSAIYFKYNRQSIIDLINDELNSDFTDIIFVTDNTIEIDMNKPLCGNI